MKKLLLFFFVSIFTITAASDIHELANKVNRLHQLNSQLTFDTIATIKFTKYKIELELSEALLTNLNLLHHGAAKNDKELFEVYEALTKKVIDKHNPLSLILLLHFYLDGTIPQVENEDIRKFGFKSPIKLTKAVHEMGKNMKILMHHSISLDLALLKFLSEVVDFLQIDKNLTSDLKEFNSVSACAYIVSERKKYLADEEKKEVEDRKKQRANFAANNQEKVKQTLDYLYSETIRTQLLTAVSKGAKQISMPMNGQQSYELWRLVREENSAQEKNDKLYISLKREFTQDHECNAISGWNICCLAWPLVFPLVFVDFERFFNSETWTLTISVEPIIETEVDAYDEF